MNIEVNLPTQWSGRLYMFGNGSFAGESFETAGRAANRARGLTAGFVTAATGTGHSAQREPGGTFAVDRQKFIDLGFSFPPSAPAQPRRWTRGNVSVRRSDGRGERPER
jgi:feruloyl esterase